MEWVTDLPTGAWYVSHNRSGSDFAILIRSFLIGALSFSSPVWSDMYADMPKTPRVPYLYASLTYASGGGCVLCGQCATWNWVPFFLSCAAATLAVYAGAAQAQVPSAIAAPEAVPVI